MIPLFKVWMGREVGDAVTKTLYSGFITQGPKVEEYETDLRKWFGYDNLLSVNSGTSALQLAVELAGVRAGDTVISTPMTCSATNTAILARQANILWADVDPLTGNMTAKTLEKALMLGDSTLKAVMMVHWGGTTCDIAGINDLAHSYGLKTIEDAAHAIGAIYRDEKIGKHSDFTCFSTQAIKHLTTGDGGILSCKSQEDYKQAKLLRWFGLDREGPRKDFRCELDLVRPGYKMHMNDINATIGIENLKSLDWIIKRHRDNAVYYSRRFRDVVDHPIGSFTEYDVDGNRSNYESSWWLYTVHVPERREEFVTWMASQGIQTSQVHAPNHKHTFTKNFYRDLPGVDKFSSTQINIPVGWWVTDQDRDHIATAVLDFFKRA